MKLLGWELLEKGMENSLLMKSSGTGGNNNNRGGGGDDHRGRGDDNNNNGGNGGNGGNNNNNNTNKGNERSGKYGLSALVAIFSLALRNEFNGNTHPQIDEHMGENKPPKTEKKLIPTIKKDILKINNQEQNPNHDIFIPVSDVNVF